ncbi:MAG TPA: efflux RND transporter periplasmic adaptor subunit [Candidatus Elarobacter sp.]|nr:efflux RND transporter periplasmic adaptor subunit [Candidatus Elarobacter sp.]
MNRRRNIIILLAGLLVVIVLGAIAARPQGKPPTARVVTVAYTRYQTKLPETGVVQRPQLQTLSALVGGNVGQIYVRPGQHVSGGQLLATISNPQIVNAEQTARAAYDAAIGRARTAQQTNATLPTTNRSAVVQAEAQLEQARFALNQAIQDQRSGAQSGLGYGGTSAAQQRAAADAAVAQRATDLREAKRIADADTALYNQKAIARNTVDQDLAKLQQAQVAYDQAVRDRNETYASVSRQAPVLADRVRAQRDAVAQAEASLAAARATASQDKSGDVQSAQADADQRAADLRYAEDQVARLRIVAPFAGVIQTIATETTDTLRPLQPGDAVTAGQAMITMSAEGGFVVRARVDEQDIANVRTGQPAIVSGEDLGTATLPGHVAQIGAVAQKSDDPSNTSRQVITTIALDKTAPFLRDGMTVDVDIVTVDKPRVLALPADAVRKDPNGKSYVLAVVNGLVKKRSVKVGISNDTQAIVTSGLEPGDVVVADRNVGITDGMHVSPTVVPTASPSPKP